MNKLNRNRYFIEDNSLPPFRGSVFIVDTFDNPEETPDVVCECYNKEYARAICDFLNKTYRQEGL